MRLMVFPQWLELLKSIFESFLLLLHRIQVGLHLHLRPPLPPPPPVPPPPPPSASAFITLSFLAGHPEHHQEGGAGGAAVG